MEDHTTHQHQHKVRNGRLKAGGETSLPFGWPSAWQSSWHRSLTLGKTMAVSPNSRLLPFVSFLKFVDACHILRRFKSSRENNLEKCCSHLPVRVGLICMSNIMQPLQLFASSARYKADKETQDPCFQFGPSQILSRQ